MSNRSKYEDMSSEEALRATLATDLQSSTFLRGAGTHYDPIFTPIFTALGFTGTITLGTFTLGTTAGLASAIATTAVTAGVQMSSFPQ